MNDNELKITYNIVKLLRYGAILAVFIGFLYALLSTIGFGGSGPAKAGQFFFAILQTMFISGFLAGVSEYLFMRRK